MTHGFEVIRTGANGQKDSYGVKGYATRKQARDAAYSFAMRSGWTEPRWWMWWRWGDTPALPNDFEYIE